MFPCYCRPRPFASACCLSSLQHQARVFVSGNLIQSTARRHNSKRLIIQSAAAGAASAAAGAADAAGTGAAGPDALASSPPQPSLELHMPVVQPTRCTRTEEVEPRLQWALGEVMMRACVEVMVERLRLVGPAKVMRRTVR